MRSAASANVIAIKNSGGAGGAGMNGASPAAVFSW